MSLWDDLMRWKPAQQLMRWTGGAAQAGASTAANWQRPTYNISPRFAKRAPKATPGAGAGYYVAPSVQRPIKATRVPTAPPTQQYLPAAAYLTPEQYGGYPLAKKDASYAVANPTQALARRSVQDMRKYGTNAQGGYWLPPQAFMTEEQWGGPATIPWNYAPPPETAEAAYDTGYGGGYDYGGGWGGGGGGGGGGTAYTPYISKWLTGLVTWQKR